MPQPLSTNLSWDMANNQWATSLNQLLSIAILSGTSINGVVLNAVTGITTINHGLGRTMQGWFVTDINAAITVFRSQPLNDKTLTLTSSGGATVNLWVY